MRRLRRRLMRGRPTAAAFARSGPNRLIRREGPDTGLRSRSGPRSPLQISMKVLAGTPAVAGLVPNEVSQNATYVIGKPWGPSIK
jgi:hypothetical protein